MELLHIPLNRTGWRLPTEKEWEYIAHKISTENLGDAGSQM